MERFAHISDTHFGFEGGPADTDREGETLLGADTYRAGQHALAQILELDPPLVVHTGDLFDHPNPRIRDLLTIQRWLRELAGLRPDGTRRQVVLLAGNHDCARRAYFGYSLDLYRQLPGVHVVTGRPGRVRFEPGGPGGPDPSLEGWEIWGVPHDSLPFPELLDAVRPDPAAAGSLLLCHGMAKPLPLYRRMIGREYAIPSDLLLRDWDFVCLGHFHRRQQVTFQESGRHAPIWYAGATANLTFQDAGFEEPRTWSMVTRAGDTWQVEPHELPSRLFHVLGPFDLTGLSPERLIPAAVTAIRDRFERLGPDRVTGSLVRVRVRVEDRGLWAAQNQEPLDRFAKEAGCQSLQVLVEGGPADPVTEAGPEIRQGMLGIETLVRNTTKKIVEPEEVDMIVKDALQLIGEDQE